MLALGFSLLTFVSTSLGGLFALRNRDHLHRILGFTAGVLSALLDLGGWSRPWPTDRIEDLPDTSVAPLR